MGEMKEQLAANERKLREANAAMQADMESMAKRMEASNSKLAQLADEAGDTKREMMANESKMRALHIIQKIMSRPDSADVFKRFDIDGDGTVDRGELKQVTEPTPTVSCQTLFGHSRVLCLLDGLSRMVCGKTPDCSQT